MMKRRNRKLKKFLNSPLFGLCVFIIIVILIERMNDDKEYNLRNNMVITNGTVSHFSADGRGIGSYVHFDYYIRDSLILVNRGISRKFKNKKTASDFIRKNFPVIYDSTDPDNSRILMDPDDFKEYGVPFPDSLNWVLPYFK